MLRTALLTLSVLLQLVIPTPSAAQPSPAPQASASPAEDENPFLATDSITSQKDAAPAVDEPAGQPSPAAVVPAAETGAPSTVPSARSEPGRRGGVRSPAAPAPSRRDRPDAALAPEDAPSASPGQQDSAEPAMLRLLRADAEELRKDAALLQFAQKRCTRREVSSARMAWFRGLPHPKEGKIRALRDQLFGEWDRVEKALDAVFRTRGVKTYIWEYPPDVRVEINDLLRRRTALDQVLGKQAQQYLNRHPKARAGAGILTPGSQPTAMERANRLAYLEMNPGDFSTP